MWTRTSHLSDEELVLLVDGELPRRNSAKAQAHLSACWDCRSRMARIESTIHEFMQAHRGSISELPPGTGPRALLKARLAELSIGRDDVPHRSAPRGPLAWAAAAAACLLLLVTGGVFFHEHAGGINRAITPNSSFLPDPRLTPGATMPADLAVLCSTPHDEVVRSVPEGLRASVLREYGLPPSREQNVEIDFLISPGLGGAEDIRNLWPQPRYQTAWNSFVKDQLEDYLHQSVCDGSLSLKRAQHDIASDWISAYEKYFRTTKPLPMVSALSGGPASGPNLLRPSISYTSIGLTRSGAAPAIFTWVPNHIQQ